MQQEYERKVKEKMKVNFATSNSFKVKEANSIGKKFNIKFLQIKEDYPEIRAESVEEVAKAGAQYVYEKLKQPIIVEDTGLYIKALNGFPGAYAKFVFQKIGNVGILKLLEGKADRQAKFISAIGYCDAKLIKTFLGTVQGEIIREPLGDGGFGYDPLFLPQGYKKTFAQDYAIKEKISHRKRVFEKFCQWLTKE